jgi:hypothetical protein
MNKNENRFSYPNDPMGKQSQLFVLKGRERERERERERKSV